MARDEEIASGPRRWLEPIPALLGGLLTATSAVGIVLALLGYGVALAVQSRFALPSSMAFTSTLDLFGLGGWAVLRVLAAASQWKSWEFYAELGKQIWDYSLRVYGYALAMGSIYLVFAMLRLAVRRWLAPGVRSQRVSDVRAFIRGRSWLLNAVAGTVSVAFTLASLPLALLAGLVILVIVCFALAAIPTMGLSAGEAYIDEWVIRPTECLPVKSREARLQVTKTLPTSSVPKKYGVPCIAVVQRDGPVEKGRLVFGTANAVILYDPASGVAKRVSLDNSKVEVIAQL